MCGVGELVLRPTFGEASWSLASDPSDPTPGAEVRWPYPYPYPYSYSYPYSYPYSYSYS